MLLFAILHDHKEDEISFLEERFVQHKVNCFKVYKQWHVVHPSDVGPPSLSRSEYFHLPNETTPREW